MKLLGTINNRIDVGVGDTESHVYIMSSSNQIIFNIPEMAALQQVLFIIYDCECNYEEAYRRLTRRGIPLFAPTTPPATITL